VSTRGFSKAGPEGKINQKVTPKVESLNWFLKVNHERKKQEAGEEEKICCKNPKQINQPRLRSPEEGKTGGARKRGEAIQPRKECYMARAKYGLTICKKGLPKRYGEERQKKENKGGPASVGANGKETVEV